MFNKPAEMPGGPAWLGYVRVKDVNQTVKKVKSARGTLINGPMEVPGGDWIAQFVDPYGAMFAVHAVAADMKPRGAARQQLLRHRREAAPAARAGRSAAKRRRRKLLPRRRPEGCQEGEAGPAKKKAAAKKKKATRRQPRRSGQAAKEREAPGPQSCEEGRPQGGQEALGRQEESRPARRARVSRRSQAQGVSARGPSNERAIVPSPRVVFRVSSR